MPEQHFMSNFGMMIPQGPVQEPPKPPKKLLCRLGWHKWAVYMITTRGGMPHQCKHCKKITSLQWPFELKRKIVRFLDTELRFLCCYGLHRWVGTYKYANYRISNYGKPGAKSSQDCEEQHYQCARCRAHKKVKIL